MKNSTCCGIPLLAFLLLFFLSSLANAAGQSGEEIFQAMMCEMCHHPKVKKRGPSFTTIATAYPDADTLFLYFDGKTAPIVDPKRAKSMQPRLRKIMKLNKTKQKALTAYVMGFKN